MPPRKTLKARRRGHGSAGSLQRVKQLGGKVLQYGDNFAITFSELDAVIEEVAAWAAKADNGDVLTPGLWASVGDDVMAELQALYALSLRRSCASLTPDTSENMRVAFCCLRARLSSELIKITYGKGGHLSAQRTVTAVFAVLRAQAIRCFSGLLADVSAQLQAQSSRRSRRILLNAVSVLTETRGVLELLHRICHEFPEMKAICDKLQACTADELQESQLLEHWSRLLLQLSMHEDWEDKARQQLYLMSHQLRSLDTLFSGRKERLCNMLTSSPCLSYMLSCHVVGLCAALDGGTTYGMTSDSDAAAAAEEDLPTLRRAVAPIFSSFGVPVRHNSPEGASTKLATWTLRLWSDALRQEHERGEDRRRIVGAMPPLHTAATLELCLRLAAAASTALTASTALLNRVARGDSASGVSGAGSGAGSSREAGDGLVLAAKEAAELAVESLLCGRQAISDAAFQFGALPRGAASRLERFCDAVGALLQAAAEHARTGRAKELSMWFLKGLRDAMGLESRVGWKVQDGPSQGAVAALRCCWVPKLDSLLRAMGANDSSWTALLPVHAEDDRRNLWPQVLAFGDLGETAPLIATVIRLLRGPNCIVPGGHGSGWALGHGAGPGPSEGMDIESLVLRTGWPCSDIFWEALEALLHSVGHAREQEEEEHQLQVATAVAAGLGSDQQGEAAGDDDASAGTGVGLQRLSLLVSYMAVHMIPEVRSDIIDFCLLKMGRTVCCGPRTAPLLQGLLHWVALLAAAHSRSAAAAAAVAGPSDEAGTGHAPSSVWRELLMADASLAKILGTALGFIATGDNFSLDIIVPTFNTSLHVLIRDPSSDLLEALHHPECRGYASMAAERGRRRQDAAQGAPPAPAAFVDPTQFKRLDKFGADSNLVVALLKQAAGSSSELERVQLPEVGPPPEAVERFRAAASLLTPSDRLLALLPLDLAAGPGRPRHAR